MDNDIFIPYKFRASQIVGLAKIAAHYIETNGIKLIEEKGIGGGGQPNEIFWFSNLLGRLSSRIVAYGNATDHGIVVSTGEGANWGPTKLELEASGTEPSGVENGFFLSLVPRLSGKGAGIIRTLFDSAERSMFMQVPIAKYPSGELVEISWGVTTISPATTKQINTGINRTTIAALASPAFNTEVFWSTEEVGKGYFMLRNRHPSFGAAFFWIAIA